MKRLLSLGAGALVSVSVAWGMGIRTTVAVVAWSSDGTSVLLEEAAAGPEGGGALSYVIACGGPPVSIMLSSDFSPGDGSTPQQVSEATCRERATALKAATAQRRFESVTVNTKGCKARAAMVKSSDEATPALPAGWKQTQKGKTLVISDSKRAVLQYEGTGTAMVSPSGQVIVLLQRAGGEIARLGIWSRGADGDFKPCPTGLTAGAE